MMLRYSLNAMRAADTLEAAVGNVLAAGWRTADIAGQGITPIGTTEMGDRVLSALEEPGAPA
jgi:3-isopropylmalate dehydrogenase